jgi:hypothetical protein
VYAEAVPKDVRVGSAGLVESGGCGTHRDHCQGSSPSPTASAKPNNRGVGKLMLTYLSYYVIM